MCSITFLGTPGMSDGCHANTSMFARRKATSALSYLGSRVALMVKVPPVPSSLADTFLVSGGVAIIFLPLLVELDGASLMVAQHSEEVRLLEWASELLRDHGPWCGGSCSTACWRRPACRRPPQPLRQSPCQSHQLWLSWRHLRCRTTQQLEPLCLSSFCYSAAGFSLSGRYPHCQILLLLCSLWGVSSLPQHVHTCRPRHIAH